MRRDEIIAAVNNAMYVLEESGLMELVMRPRQETKRSESGNSVLDAFRKYAALSGRLGEAERTLFEIFGLSSLDVTTFWETLLVNGWEKPDMMVIRGAVRNFRVFVPQIVAMLANDASRARGAAASEPAGQNAMLTIILVEEQGQASRPLRIIDSIRAIMQLYDACAFLTATEPETLAIVGCDSGSDKSFDFLGGAAAIAGLRDLIFGIWDRVVFHRQTQSEANLNQAFKTLGAVEQVAKLYGDGAIDNEQAERLKHQLLTNAATFVACGIIIPELAGHTTQDPRALMAPQPKLLTGNVGAKPTGRAADSEESGGHDTSTEAPLGAGITEEERALLDRILNRHVDNEPNEN